MTHTRGDCWNCGEYVGDTGPHCSGCDGLVCADCVGENELNKYLAYRVLRAKRRCVSEEAEKMNMAKFLDFSTTQEKMKKKRHHSDSAIGYLDPAVWNNDSKIMCIRCLIRDYKNAMVSSAWKNVREEALAVP
jgi:hypothetical protein